MQAESKHELRKACRERAAALTPEYRSAADRAIREAVLASALWRRAERVFLYVSMWAEPDTRALIEDAFAAGKRVYVPFCLPDRTMKAVPIQSLAQLRPGTLGIPEPADAEGEARPGELDLAILPCVAAGRDGARLGHGAGFYDRFLSAHRCPALCLCHEALLLDEIPMQEHDRRMDAVVTEKQIYPPSPPARRCACGTSAPRPSRFI